MESNGLGCLENELTFAWGLRYSPAHSTSGLPNYDRAKRKRKSIREIERLRIAYFMGCVNVNCRQLIIFAVHYLLDASLALSESPICCPRDVGARSCMH